MSRLVADSHHYKKSVPGFFKNHPDAETSLTNWYRTIKAATWNNIKETRADFPHADLAGVCKIFKIGGGKYRLATKIFYPAKKVLIRFVLTHAEYDRKGYRNDCEC